jgi:hypothetical protein
MNRLLLGYSPDFDVYEDAPHARLASGRTEREPQRFEAQSTELAAEFLEVVGRPGSAALLDRLVRSAARASGRALKDAVATELVGLLQKAARRALPALHAPGAAGAGTASAWASRFFGIEVEGLSPEDQEFEAARRFVQLTMEAARHAALAPARLTPAAAARQAAALAAKRYAPGWLSTDAQAPASTAMRPSPSFASAGQWVRHGPGVIVLNH